MERWLGFLFIFFLGFKVSAYAPALAPQAQKMKELIIENCKYCHIERKGRGKFYKNAGDFLKFGVLERMAGPFEPKSSVLYQKILSGEMPKDDFGDSLSDEKKDEFLTAIIDWVNAGSPPLEIVKDVRQITLEQVNQIVLEDLLKTPMAINLRYVSFADIYNNLKKRDRLPIYEQALSKLLNSISWEPKIVVPKKIDPDGVIFKIDLSDYGISVHQWEELVRSYPFPKGEEYHQNFDNQYTKSPSFLLNTAVPIIAGDWFINQASKPPFYHELARIPKRLPELESQIGLAAASEYFYGNVERAGFVDSGVSQANRIIERYRTRYGAYWLSYDFAASVGLKDIMRHPLGPLLSDDDKRNQVTAFEHDGGEIIFNLPNGLQAYMLVTNKGDRIDAGPPEIVSDPSRPDRLVRNGVSCMGCHNQGMIIKGDQVSQATFGAFSNYVLDRVRMLYGSPKLNDHILEDRQRFLVAMKAAGVKQVNPDVISTAVNDYESSMDKYDFYSFILGNFGLTEDELKKEVLQSKTNVQLTITSLIRKNRFVLRRDTFEEIIFNEIPTILTGRAGGSPKNLGLGPRCSEYLDLAHHGFGVNSVFYHLTHKAKVKILEVQAADLLKVRFLEGPLNGKFLRNVSKADLAVTSGCARDLVVGQTVLVAPRGQTAAKIIAITRDSRFVVRFQEGPLRDQDGGNWLREDLAVTSGCEQNFCVGQTVTNSGRSNAKVKIVGISFDRKFIVEFLQGQLKGKRGSGWTDYDFR